MPLDPFGDGVLKIQTLHREHLRLQERTKQLEATLEATSMRLKQKEGPRGSIANPDLTGKGGVSVLCRDQKVVEILSKARHILLTY